jgi:ABC-type Mn2+/Zn2+ transport system ATPase subunit
LVYLTQHLYFSNRLKVSDFVKFIFKLDGQPPQDFWNSINNKYMKEFIENCWQKQIGLISGGERATIYFATIAALPREWYIFDEPFSGIDKDGKEFISHKMENLASNKRNIILTSHDTEPILNFKIYCKIDLKTGNSEIIK